MMSKMKPGIALVCMYLTLNLACGNSTQDSRKMAEKVTVQANQLKQQLQQHVENPSDMRNLADNIEKYVVLAEKDGSLNRAEANIRSRRDMNSEVRKTLQQNHIKDLLLQAARNFRAIADLMPVQVVSKNVYLVTVSWKLIPVISPRDCETYEGGFLAIAAIGAVAALGGVDPLGDLLGAIGAAGAFGTYLACHRW